MERLPNVRLLLRLMINPGWAPALIATAFLALSGTEAATTYDYVFHGAGGAAIAYFFYVVITKLPSPQVELHRTAHTVFAFTLACTAAVFWEFAEFLADQRLGTTLQLSVEETIRDLLVGVAGAAVLLFILAVVNKHSQPSG